MQLVIKKTCEQNQESIEFYESYLRFLISQWKVRKLKKNVQDGVCQEDLVLGGVTLVEL